MKVVGFAGFSGSGKTTLVERLIPALKQGGLRVSVVKHAHHKFDIDHPGKDTFRHREAGAFEVLVASDRRLALIREFETPRKHDAHELLAQLDPSIDWVLVEGFKHSDLPKVEVWRAAHAAQAKEGERPPRHAQDAHIVAVATDSPAALQPAPTQPVFDLADVAAIRDWLLANADRFEYKKHPHA